ncbi:SCO3242 family prenyltransferase [Streptomyces sp. NPDC004838]
MRRRPCPVTGRARLGAAMRLVRAPAALTVPGDILAGIVSSGARLRPRAALGVASSVCLYWAGMALNDWADREIDAVERPERPIPSGTVSPGAAFALATGLTATGIGLSVAAGGRRGLVSAVALSTAIWSYDLLFKSTAAGPVVMGAARGIDVLSGTVAGGGTLRSALPSAGIVALHTGLITRLSREEVTPGPGVATAAALGIGGSAGVAVAVAAPSSGVRRLDRGASAFLAAAYLASFAPQLAAASHAPSARRVQRAVGAGIHALLPLQAGLVARSGSPALALLIAAAHPLARSLGRRITPT